MRGLEPWRLFLMVVCAFAAGFFNSDRPGLTALFVGLWFVLFQFRSAYRG